MAEVGGLCNGCLCRQGRWNGEWNDPKPQETLAFSGKLEAEAGKIELKGQQMISSVTDHFYMLQLPDDVKQNIEDAGARYIPYVLRLSRITGRDG